MSDQDESIFNEVTPQDLGEQSLPKEKSYEDLLATIRKEDGSLKYSNIESAIASIPHAQKHIATLEQELRELRVELESRKTTEELLENFKPTVENSEKPSAPSIDLKEIESILERKLTQKEQEKVLRNNIDTVRNAISEVYGEKADEIYRNAAKEANLSLSEMNRLAASSPNAVFKLIGLDKKSVQAPIRTSNSSINTDALNLQGQKPVVTSKVSGNTTKDLVSSWKNAGTIVKQKLGVE